MNGIFIAKKMFKKEVKNDVKGGYETFKSDFSDSSKTHTEVRS